MKFLSYLCTMMLIINLTTLQNADAKTKYKVIQGMKFQSFILKNRLEVLAVSDSRFVKSTAALAVKAGSQDNPKEHMGLAHYLEHMLFLGTKDYPLVGEYEDYLNKNGGSHNAYTSIDHTNYFFDIDHVGFEEAIKRFSRFFVNPTFDEKYLEREKNAVNSEHEKNLKSDNNREYRFLQTLFNSSHPYSLFSTGNKETLSKAGREEVIKFYESHYSSNLMKLVLMSNMDIAEIEKLANKYFSDIPDRDIKASVVADELFKDQKLPQFHEVQSVRDQDILRIVFNIPDDINYWEFKPVNILGELVGHEAEGTLLSILKKKGYALSLSAGGSNRTFDVRINLTETGKKHIHEILNDFYSYVNLIKKEGVKKYIFDEKKSLAQVELDNLEPHSSSDRSSSFSAAMLYYPVEKFLERYYLFHEYRPEEFNNFISYLRPDNMHVVYFSKNNKTNKTEKFYKIAYQTKNISNDELKKITESKVSNQFNYPAPNPFIPNDFNLVKKKSLDKPVEIEVSDRGSIFYQVDTELEVPKGSISLSISSDKVSANPKNFMLAKLYTILKDEELNEWGYYAKQAGLNYSISFDYNTITVSVDGYTQHLQKLIETLIWDEANSRRLNHVKISSDMFEKLKTKYRKNLENKSYDAAYQSVMYEYNNLISSSSVHYKDFIKDIEKVKLDEVNKFISEFYKNIHVKIFSYGNIRPDGYKKLLDFLYEKMSAKFIPEKDLLKFENKYIKFNGNKIYSVAGSNNNDAMLTLYRFSDWDIESSAKIAVLGKVVEQPYFTELRTNQQLGYVVSGFGSGNNGFCAMGGMIQSQVKSASELLKLSDKFYDDFYKNLDKSLTDSDIKMISQALINEIKLMPNSLAERAGRFISLAGGKYGDFSFYEKLEKRLKQTDKSSLLKWVSEEIKSKDSNRLTLLYYGSNKKPIEIKGFDSIKDLKKFKSESDKIQPYRNSKKME